MYNASSGFRFSHDDIRDRSLIYLDVVPVLFSVTKRDFMHVGFKTGTLIKLINLSSSTTISDKLISSVSVEQPAANSGY